MAEPPDVKRKSRADAVRTAVEQAFQATADQAQPVRVRALEIADELATAATKFREAIDELRPPTGDELRGLGERLAALEARVDALEKAKKPEPKRKAAAKPRPPASKRAS